MHLFYNKHPNVPFESEKSGIIWGQQHNFQCVVDHKFNKETRKDEEPATPNKNVMIKLGVHHDLTVL